MLIKGIGTDITRRDRMTFDIAKRILSDSEIKIMNSYEGEEAQLRFASGRWAAKESIIKASSKEISFDQVEILKDADGKPYVKYSGHLGVEFQISISHEDLYSIAFCIMAHKE